jgi:hypothetical protein
MSLIAKRYESYNDFIQENKDLDKEEEFTISMKNAFTHKYEDLGTIKFSFKNDEKQLENRVKRFLPSGWSMMSSTNPYTVNEFYFIDKTVNGLDTVVKEEEVKEEE